MDSIFFLDAEARRCFLRDAGRALGCLYICLWSYIPLQPNCLACMDAWFHEDDASQPSTSTLSVPHRLFDTYKRSLCTIQDSCVPGLAFKQGLPYFEVSGSELISSASLQVQQQFYQEAGVKISMQMDIRRLFSEFIPPDHNRPSSSSSLSVGSPEYSSLLLNKPSTCYLADSFRETASEQASTPSQHRLSILAFNQYGHARFPSSASDDAEMAKAMLAVISSSSSSSFSLILQYLLQCPTNLQKMIKMAIALSKRINLINFKTQAQEQRPPGNLHHMISERKRREKLNESFNALRALLPPGSKKDKASILANARDYLNTLKTEISEINEKNKMLEKKLMITEEIAEIAVDSNEDFRVQITRPSESTSQGQRIILRIEVREECDIITLVLRVLECLKSTGFISLVSIDASTLSQQMNSFARITLTLQAEASDWDEASLKEAVTQAVAGEVGRPKTEP
ncbi:hypothetical protein J5N97_025674 [Dioscorea zingiberensis]|uniref:BHLH domain-containing protein n=1 Tax=Dioscorea zingiberensis TaxID=325984 RepID=A0A9D5C0R2_9LILI|nr:hypothetical protein J5N97_025674 [Dioscorea zingiberensis]